MAGLPAEASCMHLGFNACMECIEGQVGTREVRLMKGPALTCTAQHAVWCWTPVGSLVDHLPAAQAEVFSHHQISTCRKAI